MGLKELIFGKSSRMLQMRDDPHYKDHDIGEWTYGWPKILTWDRNTRLVIGKYCSIAAGVTFILGGEHRSDWVSTYPFSEFFDEGRAIKGHPASKGDIVIGNDVWVGQNATILSGVNIGSGAIIGACAVVSKDVPPYTIMAGNPARQVRARFDERLIAALLSTRWWDLPHDQVLELIPLLLSSDIEHLIDAVESRFGKTATKVKTFRVRN